MVFKGKLTALNIKGLVNVVFYRRTRRVYSAAVKVAGGGIDGVLSFVSGIVAKEEGEL